VVKTGWMIILELNQRQAVPKKRFGTFPNVTYLCIMKQYKPKTKLIKKIGSVVLPLISGRWIPKDGHYRNSISGDVQFKNLRIYEERGIFYLKVDAEVMGYIVTRKSHLNEHDIQRRFAHLDETNQFYSSYGMKSNITPTSSYYTSSNRVKIDLTKRVKRTLEDYVEENLRAFVKVDHLLGNYCRLNHIMIDKIKYL
jgi:hypothetical protein